MNNNGFNYNISQGHFNASSGVLNYGTANTDQFTENISGLANVNYPEIWNPGINIDGSLANSYATQIANQGLNSNHNVIYYHQKEVANNPTINTNQNAIYSHQNAVIFNQNKIANSPQNLSNGNQSMIKSYPIAVNCKQNVAYSYPNVMKTDQNGPLINQSAIYTNESDSNLNRSAVIVNSVNQNYGTVPNIQNVTNLHHNESVQRNINTANDQYLRISSYKATDGISNTGNPNEIANYIYRPPNNSNSAVNVIYPSNNSSDRAVIFSNGTENNYQTRNVIYRSVNTKNATLNHREAINTNSASGTFRPLTSNISTSGNSGRLIVNNVVGVVGQQPQIIQSSTYLQPVMINRTVQSNARPGNNNTSTFDSLRPGLNKNTNDNSRIVIGNSNMGRSYLQPGIINNRSVAHLETNNDIFSNTGTGHNVANSNLRPAISNTTTSNSGMVMFNNNVENINLQPQTINRPVAHFKPNNLIHRPTAEHSISNIPNNNLQPRIINNTPSKFVQPNDVTFNTPRINNTNLNPAVGNSGQNSNFDVIMRNPQMSNHRPRILRPVASYKPVMNTNVIHSQLGIANDTVNDNLRLGLIKIKPKPEANLLGDGNRSLNNIRPAISNNKNTVTILKHSPVDNDLQQTVISNNRVISDVRATNNMVYVRPVNNNFPENILPVHHTNHNSDGSNYNVRPQSSDVNTNLQPHTGDIIGAGYVQPANNINVMNSNIQPVTSNNGMNYNLHPQILHNAGHGSLQQTIGIAADYNNQLNRSNAIYDSRTTNSTNFNPRPAIVNNTGNRNLQTEPSATIYNTATKSVQLRNDSPQTQTFNTFGTINNSIYNTNVLNNQVKSINIGEQNKSQSPFDNVNHCALNSETNVNQLIPKIKQENEIKQEIKQEVEDIEQEALHEANNEAIPSSNIQNVYQKENSVSISALDTNTNIQNTNNVNTLQVDNNNEAAQMNTEATNDCAKNINNASSEVVASADNQNCNDKPQHKNLEQNNNPIVEENVEKIKIKEEIKEEPVDAEVDEQANGREELLEKQKQLQNNTKLAEGTGQSAESQNPLQDNTKKTDQSTKADQKPDIKEKIKNAPVLFCIPCRQVFCSDTYLLAHKTFGHNIQLCSCDICSIPFTDDMVPKDAPDSNPSIAFGEEVAEGTVDFPSIESNINPLATCNEINEENVEAYKKLQSLESTAPSEATPIDKCYDNVVFKALPFDDRNVFRAPTPMGGLRQNFGNNFAPRNFAPTSFRPNRPHMNFARQYPTRMNLNQNRIQYERMRRNIAMERRRNSLMADKEVRRKPPNQHGLVPNTTDLPFMCLVCGSGWWTEQQLFNHMACHEDAQKSQDYSREYHGDKLQYHDDKRENASKKLEYRDLGLQYFDDVEKPQPKPKPIKKIRIKPPLHVKITHPTKRELPTHKCEQCSQIFTRLRSLESHKRVVHGVRPVCELCNKEVKNLKHHIDFVHKGVRLYCEHCKRPFSSRASLVRHQKDYCHVVGSKERVHNDQTENVSCDRCQKEFKRSFGLLLHQRYYCYDENEERPFSCEVCDKKFLKKAFLDCHRKRHFKKFPCTICKKSFSDKYHLERHNLIHTGEQPFQCDLCNMRFRRKCKLRTHIIRGCNSRAKCKHCGRTFRSYKSLKQHNKSVCNRKLNKRQYVCDNCHARYSHKRNLIRHVKAQDCTFKCKVCSVELSSKYVLGNHIKKRHPEKYAVYIKRARKRMLIRMHRGKNPGKKIDKYSLDGYYRGKGVVSLRKKYSLRNHCPSRIKTESVVDYRFNCSICPLKFTEKIYLVAHENLHSEYSYRIVLTKAVGSVNDIFY